MGSTDRELLVGVARGSDRAARELWSRHGPRLRAFLRALLPAGGPVDAEDVLQQTFCRILEAGVSTLRDVEDVPAWLFQVARNIAFNSGRSERRERARREVRRAAQRGEATGTQSPVLDGSGHDEGLSRALAGLMPEMRDVVLLKHVAGLTFDQIAIATRTNRNTAASRYRSAIGLLESALSEKAGGVGMGTMPGGGGFVRGTIPLSSGPTACMRVEPGGAVGASGFGGGLADGPRVVGRVANGIGSGPEVSHG